MSRVKLILTVATVLAAVGCSQKMVDGIPATVGEMLYTKLNGDKVQVLRGHAGNYRITCRVLTGRRLRDGIVSADSYKSEYVVVYFDPCELTRTPPKHQPKE